MNRQKDNLEQIMHEKILLQLIKLVENLDKNTKINPFTEDSNGFLSNKEIIFKIKIKIILLNIMYICLCFK